MPLSNRYQMTVNFGSNEKGLFYSKLMDKLCKRYNQEPTEIVRIAIRTLEHVKKEYAILDDK